MGMTCSACSLHVEKAVGKLSGIQSVAVNLLQNSMIVEYDATILNDFDIIHAVEDAGYGAYVVGAHVAGTHVAGTHVADTHVAGTHIAGTHISDTCANGTCVSADAEKETALLSGPQANHPVDLEAKEMRRRLFWSVIFLIPLACIAMGPMIGIPLPSFLSGYENAVAFGMVQLLLTLVIVYLNRRYFINGFKSLIKRAPTMDALIAIGSSAAIIYGIYALVRIGYGMAVSDFAVVEHYHMDMYFESAGMILTLVTAGKYMEHRSKGKTSDAISRLVDLEPKTAVVERNGMEMEIPAAGVVVGDIVVIRPGNSIPADGTVVEGNAVVDESMITGESVPIEKTVGDSVTGATINHSGFIKIRAVRVGEDTTLARIIRLVEEASAGKAPISKLADRVSAFFVPVVIAIAVIAAAVWLLLGYPLDFALSIGIAVLVISCPCALGLATPTAIMVGTGKAAENGILFRNAEVLETAHTIKTVILDKTGTVTEGKPSVVGLYPAKGISEKELLGYAAAVEKMSEHPLAKAIVEKAVVEKADVEKTVVEKTVVENADVETAASVSVSGSVSGSVSSIVSSIVSGNISSSVSSSVSDNVSGSIADLQASDFKQIAGRGIQAVIGGKTVHAGNALMMKAEGVDILPFEMIADEIAGSGQAPLYVSRDGRLLGIIAVADTIKPTSARAVAELKKMGLSVVLMTGDNERTAEAVARQAGIDHVIAGVLPQEKESQVKELQAGGQKVAMIGDGINDAPALTRADVGIAIGAGTDIAIESADIVLMKSDLMDAVTAIQLSGSTIRNIKQNLFWAFFYNTLGIPLAAGVFYPLLGWKLSPIFAAAAMSLSSLFVVTNALRLKFFKPKYSTHEQSHEWAYEQSHEPKEPAGAQPVDYDPIQMPVAYENNILAKIEIQIKKETTEKNDGEEQMNYIIKIEGMSCNNCKKHVEVALNALPGVQAAVDLAAGTADVKTDGNADGKTLTEAVTKAGYAVISVQKK